MSASNRGQFKPGVSGNPNGRPPKQTRRDSFINTYTGHGTSDDRRTYTTHRTCAIADVTAIDLRRGNWLAKRIIELLPSECFRCGYTLKLDDKETSETVMTAIESLGINTRLAEAGQMERTAGGAALFPVLDGALGDLSEPLDLDSGPRIASVRAIHMLEPRELVPVAWYTDITSLKFRKPSHYQLFPLAAGGVSYVSQQVIHETRLAIFPGARASIQTLPGQRLGWGDSALTPCDEAIRDFGLAWGSAASILHTFSQRVLKMNGLMQMLAQGGAGLVQQRMQVQDLYRSTLRTEVIDGDDNLESLITSISGLPDLLVQLAQVVSAAADTPMTRLFGMHPAGLNATGKYDSDGWHDRVSNEQTHKYTAPTEWLIRLLLLSSDGPTGGDEPDVWSIEWDPLQEMNELESANTRLLVAQADQIYADMGAPAEDILKSRFAGDTYSPETSIDWTSYEKLQQQQQQRMAMAAALPRSPVPTGNTEQPKEQPGERAATPRPH